jgi:hypothetical protein
VVRRHGDDTGDVLTRPPSGVSRRKKAKLATIDCDSFDVDHDLIAGGLG